MKKLIPTIFFALFNVGMALAEGGGPNPTGGGPLPTGGNTGGQITLINPLNTGSFADVVQKIIGALYTLSIPICSIMVLVGGYYILTSSGDEEKLKTGRKTIMYAAVGFAIILIANGVTYLIRQIIGI